VRFSFGRNSAAERCVRTSVGCKQNECPDVMRSGFRIAADVRQTGAMTSMNSVSIFWMQILTSVFVFGIIAVWYVRPYLTTLSRNSALTLLLFVHVPRYVGMTLLVSGMIDPKLPREFLSSTAYGDLLEAALAFASIFASCR
jgi:hypothetical protein